MRPRVLRTRPRIMLQHIVWGQQATYLPKSACGCACLSANDIPPAAPCHFGWESATGPALTGLNETNGVSRLYLCQSGTPRGSRRMFSSGCAMLHHLPDLAEPAVRDECGTLTFHEG